MPPVKQPFYAMWPRAGTFSRHTVSVSVYPTHPILSELKLNFPLGDQ